VASVHPLTTADDAACDADDRVLMRVLSRRNSNRRGRREPLALFFPLTGTATEIDPVSGRLSSGGPVGPQPAATSHGSDGGEVG